MAYKFKKHFGSKKRYLIALLVLLILLLMTTLELTNTTHFFHKQKLTPTLTPVTTEKTHDTTPKVTETTAASTKTTDTSTTSSSSKAITGTVTISRVSQLTGSTMISLRTVVSGISSGTCVVVFSKSGQPDVQQSATVIANASYYSCAGVDVPVSQFSVSGLWDVSVHIVDSQSATISNTAVSNNIQVQK